MDENQLQALFTLLDDPDTEIAKHVIDKLTSLGTDYIPRFEQEWENNANTLVQFRLENIIHTLQYDSLSKRLINWKNNNQEDLMLGLSIISSYQYPELSIEVLRAQIDQLYYEAWLNFKDVENPLDKIRVLNNVFFDVFKFSANSKNFHSPNNNYINNVLETKKGNPISLCSVYMMIAQKLDIPVFGVNLPNLFVLTYKDDHEQFYINVFNRGLIFSKRDIDNYIKQINLEPLEEFYEPCSNLDIIKRVLRNLLVSYEKENETNKQDEIKYLLDQLDENENPS